jgi:hypothetical protein
MSRSAAAASAALSIVETVQLTTAAGDIWDAISDFASWPTWNPAFASTTMVRGTGRTAGSVRVLVAKDGARFTEELVAFDAAARSYSYRIIESPAPLIGYVSTIRVEDAARGCRVTWSSTFHVKAGSPEQEVKQMIAGIYRLGLDHLAGARA